MSVSIHALKTLYEDVIQDVVKSMKTEFDNEGVDDQVLGELEALWRSKLEETGVLSEGLRETAYYDQNFGVTYPHSQTTQYTNYAGLQPQHNPPTSAYVPTAAVPVDYTQLQQAGLGAQHGPQNMMFAQSQMDSMQHSRTTNQLNQAANQRQAAGKQGHLMQQVQQQLQYAASGNNQYYVPPAPLNQQAQPQYYANPYQQYAKQMGQVNSTGEEVPEVQGLVGQEVVDRTAETAKNQRAGTTSTATETAELGAADKTSSIERYGDLDAEELGSELDEPDNDEGEEDPDTDHLVLCQFDKVTRNKSKWKVTLKDGVMHINNRDYVFHKATGEFDWA